MFMLLQQGVAVINLGSLSGQAVVGSVMLNEI